MTHPRDATGRGIGQRGFRGAGRACAGARRDRAGPRASRRFRAARAPTRRWPARAPAARTRGCCVALGRRSARAGTVEESLREAGVTLHWSGVAARCRPARLHLPVRRCARTRSPSRPAPNARCADPDTALVSRASAICCCSSRRRWTAVAGSSPSPRAPPVCNRGAECRAGAGACPTELLRDGRRADRRRGELTTSPARPVRIGAVLAGLDIPLRRRDLGARAAAARASTATFCAAAALRSTPSIPPPPATPSAARWSPRCAAATTLPQALRQASAASALACTRSGAQSSIPPRAELEAPAALGRRPVRCTGRSSRPTAAARRGRSRRHHFRRPRTRSTMTSCRTTTPRPAARRHGSAAAR